MTSYFSEPEFAEGFSESRKATAAATAARIIEFARIQPGHRVIDLCCGPGLVSQHVSECVGSAGELIGVDASAAMIDLARQHVPAANSRFVVGDAYDLPSIVPDPVDHIVATSAWQNFLSDKPRIISSVRGVLTPSGRFTFDVRLRDRDGVEARPERWFRNYRERVLSAIREEYPGVSFDERHDAGPFGLQDPDRKPYTRERIDEDIAFMEANGLRLAARHELPGSGPGEAGGGRMRWRVEYWLSRTVPELPAEARVHVLDRVAEEMRRRRPAAAAAPETLTTYLVMEAR